jgi:hypothetical protein
LARKGGAASLYSSLPRGAFEITFHSRTVHYGKLRVVVASDSRPEHVPAAVSLMAALAGGHDRLITHRIPLTKLPARLELMKRMQSPPMLAHP